MSGPNLSEYFTNDAPSMFDEIITNTAAVPLPTTIAQPITPTSLRSTGKLNL